MMNQKILLAEDDNDMRRFLVKAKSRLQGFFLRQWRQRL